MVYQDTFFGPSLWNTYVSDYYIATRSVGFKEIIYANDLNAWKDIAPAVTDEEAFELTRTCQSSLHDWGKANRICFDATKESMHILSRSRPAGAGPKILGINFDTKLVMTDAVDKCVSGASWCLYSLLRTRRFHDDAELVCLFKAHILSYIEYRTSAVSHASASVLGPLDALQTRFLKFASYICSRCTDVF